MTGLWIAGVLALALVGVLYLLEREESAVLREQRDTARRERDEALARQVPLVPFHHISRLLTAEDIAGELVREQQRLGVTR